MTREELLALPAVVDVVTAAEALGVGRKCAYEMVRSGAWPTEVLRFGRFILVPTAPLLQLLGVWEPPVSIEPTIADARAGAATDGPPSNGTART